MSADAEAIKTNTRHANKQTDAVLLPSVSSIANKMVIVHAVPCMYSDIQRTVLLVQKPDSSPYHPGFLNLPGGHIKQDEKPVDAALRELKEETGLDGTFPQYMGCIRPPLVDRESEGDYVVYAYRAQVSSFQQLESEPGQPAHWHTIQALSYMLASPPWKIVPNLIVLLPLLIAGMPRGWTYTESSGEVYAKMPFIDLQINVMNPAYQWDQSTSQGTPRGNEAS